MSILAKLNGWQRLWLVFSVLTFLATSSFVLYDAGSFFMEDIFVLRGMGSNECKYVYTMPRGLDARYANLDQFRNHVCISLYEYLQANAEPLSATEFLKELEQRKKEYLLGSGTAYFGMWLFTVIAIYVSGLIVAWIRRGFAKQNEGN